MKEIVEKLIVQEVGVGNLLAVVVQYMLVDIVQYMFVDIVDNLVDIDQALEVDYLLIPFRLLGL